MADLDDANIRLLTRIVYRYFGYSFYPVLDAIRDVRDNLWNSALVLGATPPSLIKKIAR